MCGCGKRDSNFSSSLQVEHLPLLAHGLGLEDVRSEVLGARLLDGLDVLGEVLVLGGEVDGAAEALLAVEAGVRFL